MSLRQHNPKGKKQAPAEALFRRKRLLLFFLHNQG